VAVREAAPDWAAGLALRAALVKQAGAVHREARALRAAAPDERPNQPPRDWERPERVAPFQEVSALRVLEVPEAASTAGPPPLATN
jgi:hypothetical protein